MWQGAVERTVTGLGYELVDAEKGVGGLLRVVIDHAAPPSELPIKQPIKQPMAITVDDCERVTRQLQHVLEVEGCAYERLEVSSPGLDRPLKKAADYERFTGEQIELTLKLPFQGRKRYRGELQPNGDGWRLLLAGEAPAKTRGKAPAKSAAPAADAAPTMQALDFALDEVREAHLVPVLDFKGRRFAAPDAASTPVAAAGHEEMDGGSIQ